MRLDLDISLHVGFGKRRYVFFAMSGPYGFGANRTDRTVVASVPRYAFGVSRDYCTV